MKSKPGRRSRLRLVAIIAAVITLALLVSAGFRIKDYASGSMLTYDIRAYLYDADRGRFGDLYDTALQDMERNAVYSQEVAEYRALAFYYEQAVLEQACRSCGEDERAEEFARRRAEYEEQLCSLAARADQARQAATPPAQAGN